MATRCNIAVKLNDKSDEYVQIYSHWDGYPAHTLKILKEHFNTYEKVLELVKGGEVSKFKKDGTIDRLNGEIMQAEKLKKPKLENQYLYIFENGEWTYEKEYYNIFKYVL